MPHIYSNTLPDPFLPLIDLAQGSAYTLADGQEGIVHPQRRDQHRRAHHPTLFYVEHPRGSSDYYEVDALRLAAIHGETVPARGFTHPQFAAILGAVPACRLFRNILIAAKPL